MFSELTQLRNALLRSMLCFILSALVFFAVPFQSVHIHETIPFLIPSEKGTTTVSWMLQRIQTDLVPEGVQLVTSNPLDPFTTQAKLALLLALFISFPYALFEMYTFIKVALYPRERRALARILFFSCLLFAAGAFFAYTIVIPLIFSSLFGYLPHDVSPIYNLRELISLVAGLTATVSFLFLLPVCMVLLTQSRLISASFWLTYARHAILLVVILSAIITPDGSGISMVLLAVPVCVLYAVGYIVSKFVAPKTPELDNH